MKNGQTAALALMVSAVFASWGTPATQTGNLIPTVGNPTDHITYQDKQGCRCSLPPHPHPPLLHPSRPQVSSLPMHCKNCDYPLWNLPTRACPECGMQFRPSDYQFVVNSVQFCCPHCGQSYYGTGADGHLSPREFDCVSCGEHVTMDEMVLRPAAGVDERLTRASRMPWLERREVGPVKAWFKTVWWSMIRPGTLMKVTPATASVSGAWWYATLTLGLIVFFSVSGPFIAWSLALVVAGDPAAAGLAIAGAASWPIAMVIMLVLLAIWGLVTDLVLRLSGGCESGMGRTFHALCYSSGAMAITAVPCVWLCGIISWAGMIWWLVSAILMVAQGQKVHGGRATLAVLIFPIGLVLLGAAAYFLGFALMFSSLMLTPFPGPGGGWGDPVSMTQDAWWELDAYATDHNGQLPGHAAQMIPHNMLSADSFIRQDTNTYAPGVVFFDGSTLDQLQWMAPNRQKLKADAVAAALPANAVAHRLGDFVFTYHGVDYVNGDGALWLVVSCPDPDVNVVNPGTLIVVGCLDGTVQTYSGSMPATALAAQNQLRNAEGLPPLPDPLAVTHAAPAVAPAPPPTAADPEN